MKKIYNESDMQKNHADDENHDIIEGIIIILKHVIIFSYYDYIFTRTSQLHILNSVL